MYNAEFGVVYINVQCADILRLRGRQKLKSTQNESQKSITFGVATLHIGNVAVEILQNNSYF